jgi:RNA polymerase sigma-70 factor (ECF subfamily)
VNRLTDELLIERLCQGQTDALDVLYMRYAKQLYVFCYNTLYSKNPQQSEDLVQDVFLRVIKAAHNFDPQKASFRTWLFRIARNRCIDTNRRRAILNLIPIVEPREQENAGGESLSEETLIARDDDVEASVVQASVSEAVRECISKLDSDDERQAIVLYYLGDKVYREIGEILGKSTSMARNRVESARVKVKRCLERKGINEYP